MSSPAPPADRSKRSLLPIPNARWPAVRPIAIARHLPDVGLRVDHEILHDLNAEMTSRLNPNVSR
jgi:hypothetical protein